ncbi:hypothetical protein A4R35_00095 [Thermogemmatispora tikiterensis]|uniref:Uncharacterized protein n=1 Tax=Thermogemmatispora tikiterensis TaxID=1825093 RepID=A0A328VDU1_9CHLR|nr:hypothetical protein A4R35_00095 [Thermogemmatispora tikiterensis]
MSGPGKPDAQLKRSTRWGQWMIFLRLLGPVVLAMLVVPWHKLALASAFVLILTLTFALLVMILLLIMSQWAVRPSRDRREGQGCDSRTASALTPPNQKPSP